MLYFYVLKGDAKRQCTATDGPAAVQILKLMFPGDKAYVVDGDKVSYAQNMPMEDAMKAAGFAVEPIQSIVVLPAPKAAKAKPKKVVKPAKAKKTVVKSKVKPKVTKPVAKTVVKSKTKPKVKSKVIKPAKKVAKKAVVAKGKKSKRS